MAADPLPGDRAASLRAADPRAPRNGLRARYAAQRAAAPAAASAASAGAAAASSSSSPHR